MESGVGENQVREWFWEVLHEMTDEQRAKFLAFVTSSRRVPPGGFEFMPREPFQIWWQPKPALPDPGRDRTPEETAAALAQQQAAADRNLPAAHTCFNRIDLRLYSSKDILRDKLLYAIRNTGTMEEY